jgi:hypothetical protein
LPRIVTCDPQIFTECNCWTNTCHASEYWMIWCAWMPQVDRPMLACDDIGMEWSLDEGNWLSSDGVFEWRDSGVDVSILRQYLLPLPIWVVLSLIKVCISS